MRTEIAVDDTALRLRAIDPGRSCIVQAPAGSGKTSLLTMRYLRLLAEVEHPEQIVAITFTRKAAAEMRHRIVEALRSAPGPPQEGSRPHELEIHQLAAAALARSRLLGWGLENNPSRLHLQTIDGLNHWLARRLPLAARIGLSAALVDDAQPMYGEAARRLVAGLDGDSQVAAPIERLATALDHEPWKLTQLVESMLGTRELWLPKLLASAGGPEWRDGIDRLLQSAIELELGRITGELAAFDTAGLFELIGEVAVDGGENGPLAPLAGLTAWPPPVVATVPRWLALAELLLVADPRPALRKTVQAKQGFLAASEGAAWAGRKRRMVELLERLAGQAGFAATIAKLRGLPPAHLSDPQWERIDALRAVLPHAVAELLGVFAERASLDHAAVAAAARDALGHESAPTELALALDYRIRHLLVDEFQDTSPAQMRLLELLVAGWQADDGRSLFCVGDPMQSIYGFREADVTLFLQAQQQGIGGVALGAERLTRNFRSSPAIVAWVNDAFGSLLPAADDFERGAVRYSPAAAVNAGLAADGVFIHPLSAGDERAMGTTVAGLVAKNLADAPGDRPPSLAILIRGRGSLPPLLAALRSAGIEYRGVELESLHERQAIRDLVALAKALLHAGDRTAWLAVLRAPWCGLSLADLHALAGAVTAPLGLSLADPDQASLLSADGGLRLRSLQARLAPVAAERGERRLGNWLKAAWLALSGPATVEDPSDLANAELLFTALDGLEREAGCMPAAAAIDAVVARIKASPVGSETASVQIMTIHRAKGLEFDVVIVPDLQRSVRGAERPLLYWSQIATGPGSRGIVLASRSESGAEEGTDALERWMRLLGRERDRLELGRIAYVAATRARRELHLIGAAAIDARSELPALRQPPSGSLLNFLWPVVEEEFKRVLLPQAAAAAADAEASSRPRRTAPPLMRLPAGYVAPEPPASLPVPRLRIAGAPGGAIRPDFDWASAIAQAVGQAVHLELHRLARSGKQPAEIATRPEAWRRALRESGIDDDHLPAALARVERALTAIRSSDTAARLLDPAAHEGASELALTAVIDGVVLGLRIDRSFVDDRGRRWIVDWKTSVHEGGDVNAFLDNELARYTPQLERYARVMKRIDSRPQVVGLYFPLHDAWRQLPGMP